MPKRRRLLAVTLTVAFNTVCAFPICYFVFGVLLGVGGVVVLSTAEACFVLWLVGQPRRQDEGFGPLLRMLAILLGIPLFAWFVGLAFVTVLTLI